MKYVIIQSRGMLYPILFHDNISHDTIIPPCSALNGERKIFSAGFCSFDIGTGDVSCFGKSETLKIESKPAYDNLIIQNWIDFGESMLAVVSANIISEVAH